MVSKDDLDIDALVAEVEAKLNSIAEQNQNEQDFALEANNRFNKNLIALEKYFPKLADSVKDYQPREDFKIDVTISKHGNFIPKDSPVPLYDNDPITQSREQIERYTKDAHFGRTDYFATGPVSLDDSSESRIHMKHMEKLFQQLCVTDPEQPILKTLPEVFPSAMIFGIGLGYHIPLLLEKHSFDFLFITEPDFELFFASLFCIEWDRIIYDIDEAGKSLFITVGSSYEDFFTDLFALTADVGAFSIINAFCYQHYPSIELNKLIKAFFANYYRFHQGYGFYNDAITGLSHAIHHVKKQTPFLFASNEARNWLENIPAFVVGNGPSLDESLEFIRENQDKAVIFASGTALQTLLRADIKPDFHVLVERPKDAYVAQLQLSPEGGYKEINFLGVDVLYPDLTDLYAWSGLGLKGPEASSVFLRLQTGLKMKRLVSILQASGPMVSNTSFSYALTIGFKEIYLFGVDNGFVDSNKTHASHSVYSDAKNKDKFPEVKSSGLTLEGNFGGEIQTTSLMSMSKASFELLTKPLSNEYAIYNVGDGAKINKALPLHEDDLLPLMNSIDKPSLIERIKSELFMPLELGDIEASLGIDEFESVIDHLIDIGNRPYQSRQEATAILIAQQRLIEAYKKSKQPQIYHLLKGTLIYTHCPLITVLYFYDSEVYCLKKFKISFAVWMDFLKEVRNDFRKNWYTKCDWVHELLREYDSDSNKE
ncbi:DUF115 domain-containing protein [Pseudoalteromonas xiamenensis]|uniref:motility associated factor glycosyltransferase family protein n=1 Tax=Pseudoalteromonas xiamenensis TaxID=882626 RepID=UPI0027E3D221|nr:6-hydroxymethylpterin diphosphokinase MptE-like protein [Pseudoalteromonas xiamenensis]WMN59378.1 DUF115 domain-containing protein [Pseudoalteromonas xiamenensis]